MPPLVSIARSSSVAARCAFCHDALGVEWDACPGCDTRLHFECRSQAVECPTLGCAKRLPVSRSTARLRPSFRHALARISERSESARLRPAAPAETEEDDPPALSASELVANAVLSPLVLGVLATYFLALHAPLYWLARCARSARLTAWVRQRSREASRFVAFEAAVAPFLVLLAVAAAASTGIDFGAVPSYAVFGAVALLLVPPTLDWLGASRGAG
jgi:hypothetical protein